MSLLWWFLGAVLLWYLYHKIDDVAFAYVDGKVHALLPQS